jgi:hypothetical protein
VKRRWIVVGAMQGSFTSSRIEENGCLSHASRTGIIDDSRQGFAGGVERDDRQPSLSAIHPIASGCVESLLIETNPRLIVDLLVFRFSLNDICHCFLKAISLPRHPTTMTRHD